MTKPICAAAAMILAEEGHLNLNSPVSKFIPGFADLKVFVKKNPDGSTETEPLKTPVTIRHLMTHTSGLVYGINPADPVDALFIAERNRTQQLIGAAEKTSAEVIDDLLPVPLAFQPGSQWRYGNNFEALGRILEIISGQDLADFCEERIFGPLGMVDTAFHCPLEKLDRLYPLYGHTLNPTTYQKDPDAPILRKPITWPFATSKPAFCSGGFGLCSTLDDYAKLCRLMVNGGELDGVRLLSPKTVEMWSVNQAPEEALPYGIPPQLGKGFSLGTYVVTDPAMLGYAQNVGSYSWSGAWSTTMVGYWTMISNGN
jgi:CubicO group peptidase (beta-lactamase class C family)